MMRKMAPDIVEVPQRIYDDIIRHCENHFIPFGSVEWDCYKPESDIDFLVHMDEWDIVKKKWFVGEKINLIRYDEATFQSIKLSRKDDNDARILNLIFVNATEYDINVKAINEMQYHLKTPMIRNKMFRVRLFELIKETIRAKLFPEVIYPSASSVVTTQSGNVISWHSATLDENVALSSTTATAPYVISTSERTIIQEEDQRVLDRINSIIQEDDIDDIDDPFDDEDLPF